MQSMHSRVTSCFTSATLTLSVPACSTAMSMHMLGSRKSSPRPSWPEHGTFCIVPASARFPPSRPAGLTAAKTSYLALLSIGDRHSNVIFHDAVRPLVGSEIISACINALTDHAAVDTATPSSAPSSKSMNVALSGRYRNGLSFIAALPRPGLRVERVNLNSVRQIASLASACYEEQGPRIHGRSTVKARTSWGEKRQTC